MKATIENTLNAEIEDQLRIFRRGIPFVTIVKPASIGEGIKKLSEDEKEFFANLYDRKKVELDVVKFVPASGAATRMFKFLHQFLSDFNPLEDDIDDFLKDPKHAALKEFFESRKDFAFHDLILEQLVAKNPDYQSFSKAERYYLFVEEMLSESGLNFGDTPKGLVPFHSCSEDYRTAFGEQLYESVHYAAVDGKAKVHFTVSPQHKEKFKNRFDQIERRLEDITGVAFDISYSFQKKETDTIAVTLDNEPFRDQQGELLFRPAGHGALLENLNEIDADVIFIKNIDNVIHRNSVEEIGFYKRVLAGKLVHVRDKIHSLLEQLTTREVSSELIDNARDFLQNELVLELAPVSKEEIIEILNRPIRVCGVVENTGAPGGGPFLVRHSSGRISPQIVEMSQIDLSDESQKDLVSQATHFNPVDLVCSVRDFHGKKFDLRAFSDSDTGFISEKSHQGAAIKALERPGLWNGAMAFWNTIFVEVPLITFNPVKTVNDLLNNAHRGL